MNNDIDYRRIGNISGYDHRLREVIYAGLIADTSLALKLYDMHERGSDPISRILIDQCTDFIKKEINDENIHACIGMGFVILSEDTINVARWDDEIPYILKNDLYVLEPDIFAPKRAGIAEMGPFCAFELGIVSFEREQWLKYLESNGTELDKKRYLGSFINGPV